MRFKPGHRAEVDEWTIEGEKISDPEKLEVIRKVLEDEGPVLLEHRFLRGGRGPDLMVFEDLESMTEYLSEYARAGDAVSVWSLWPFIRDTPPLVYGKCPAEDGTVPRGGAY